MLQMGSEMEELADSFGPAMQSGVFWVMMAEMGVAIGLLFGLPVAIARLFADGSVLPLVIGVIASTLFVAIMYTGGFAAFPPLGWAPIAVYGAFRLRTEN